MICFKHRRNGGKGEAGLAGQSSMMVVAVSVLMLVFIMIFLITSSLNSPALARIDLEEKNLFAHNMLLSLMRKDTNAGVFSDVLKDAYFQSGREAEAFVRDNLPVYIRSLLNATSHPEYDWFFEASPKNFPGADMTVGNAAVKDTPDRWDARTIITWEGYQLEVKIYMKTK